MGESTVDIQCLFISGSDAIGCNVVVVSDYQRINNETSNLARNYTSAYGQLNLKHKISCYHRVVAYTITTDHQIVSIFSLEKILSSAKTNTCSGKFFYNPYGCTLSWISVLVKNDKHAGFV